jgi:hypothetical protein
VSFVVHWGQGQRIDRGQVRTIGKLDSGLVSTFSEFPGHEKNVLPNDLLVAMASFKVGDAEEA